MSVNSGSYSVQPATGNREHGPEKSGGLAETPATGNREYMAKGLSECEKPTRTQ